MQLRPRGQTNGKSGGTPARSAKTLLVSLAFLASACSLLQPLWPGDANCDVDIRAIESRIDGLAEAGRIRPDQASARKEALRREWARYQDGQVSCERFLEKAEYLQKE